MRLGEPLAADFDPDLAQSIDAVHLHIRDAFHHRDLPAYSRYVASDLTYTSPDGRTQNREELLRSLQQQFERLVSFESRFDRESLTPQGNEVVETGTQTAAIALRVFGLFAVRWRVTRHGRYTWRRDAQVGWTLREVLLDREQVQRAGIGLAL